VRLQLHFHPADGNDSCRLNFTPIVSALEELGEADGRAKLRALVDQCNAVRGRAGDPLIEGPTRSGFLGFPHALMASMHRPVIDAVIDHVRGLLAQPAAADVKFVLLVGGFAESPYVQYAMGAALETSHRSVIVPHRVGKLVTTGAAWYGLFPDVFTGTSSR
jgi:hypothetical protein